MTYKPSRVNRNNQSVHATVPSEVRPDAVDWSYYPKGYLGAEDTCREVCWSSIGSVSPDEARAFALAILRACDEVEACAHELEREAQGDAQR